MRISVSRVFSILIAAAAVILSENTEALALDGYYMGQWAPDKEACGSKASPHRLILEQTDLRTPQLHCKLLGLRQDDESGTTFVAHCSDINSTWNDEITVKADIAHLQLKLRTGGPELQLVRCVLPAANRMR